MDRETIIEGLRRGLATADPSVVVAYLFGSVARGQHAGESDIDVAVLFDPPPPARLLGPPSSIHDQLETAVSRRVDLIVLNQASPDLIHRVLRDGVVLYERELGERIRFEVRARNEYFDIKPYLDEYRRAQTA